MSAVSKDRINFKIQEIKYLERNIRDIFKGEVSDILRCMYSNY